MIIRLNIWQTATLFVPRSSQGPEMTQRKTCALCCARRNHTAVSQPNKLSESVQRMLGTTDRFFNLTLTKFDHLALTMALGANEDAVLHAWERVLEIMVRYPPDVETVCAPEFPIHSLKAMPLTDAFLASAGLVRTVYPQWNLRSLSYRLPERFVDFAALIRDSHACCYFPFLLMEVAPEYRPTDCDHKDTKKMGRMLGLCVEAIMQNLTDVCEPQELHEVRVFGFLFSGDEVEVVAAVPHIVEDDSIVCMTTIFCEKLDMIALTSGEGVVRFSKWCDRIAAAGKKARKIV
eukprot:Opistho-2@93468